VIPNDRILATVAKETTLKQAFAACDDILKQAVEGISELITHPGIINVDFADIRAVMENAGSALMGIGIASGENRATTAAHMAVSSPLLEISINGAKGVLFAIAGGDDLGMVEVHEAAKIITESVDPNAKIIFGAVKDDKLKKNEIRVTVIATGFPNTNAMPRGNQLFNFNRDSRDSKETKEADAPVLGKIYNAPIIPTIEPETKKEPMQPKPESKDDDDEWGAVPSFLRRPKIK
jgi:cell division protein FtsZ